MMKPDPRPEFAAAFADAVHRAHRRDDGVLCSALFSADEKYRYRLNRIWDVTKPIVRFIGLNPSTATETEDDPTIRRCVRFAHDWGCGGLIMLNAFAFRSTDPKGLQRTPDPIGILNDYHLLLGASAARDRVTAVVCCWGTHGDYLARGRRLFPVLREESGDRLKVFGLTQDRHPKHPLYMRADTKLQDWR